MSGGGINVYFGEDCQKIIERMEKGELSKVCQKAVRGWDISSDDVLVLEAQEEILQKEKNIIDDKINAIDKKLDVIAKTEMLETKKRFEEEEKIKKELEPQKGRIKRDFMGMGSHIKPQEIVERYFKLYWGERLNGKNPDMGRFIGRLRYKEQNLDGD